MSENSLSQSELEGVIRMAKIIKATLSEIHGFGIDHELEEFLDVPAWQKEAVRRIYYKMKVGVDRIDWEHGDPAEVLGKAMGAVFGVHSSQKMKNVPPEIVNLLGSPSVSESELFSKLGAESDSWRAAFHKGFGEGYQLLLNNGEPRYFSDASELYLTMLIYADQLKYLKSWNDIYAFVIECVPEYKGRRKSMEKALERIGFSMQS